MLGNTVLGVARAYGSKNETKIDYYVSFSIANHAVQSWLTLSTEAYVFKK